MWTLCVKESSQLALGQLSGVCLPFATKHDRLETTMLSPMLNYIYRISNLQGRLGISLIRSIMRLCGHNRPWPIS